MIYVRTTSGAKMASQNIYLVMMGSLCLIVALIEAWLLVAVFSSDDSPVSRIVPGRQDLLRSHIDYLMMSQFLFVFLCFTAHSKLRRRSGWSLPYASVRFSIRSLFLLGP